MLKSHLKIALRYLLNHKSYALINIIGLTLGFLCFLLLNAYISSEKNFDKQHGNVYRLLQKKEGDNGEVQEIASLGPQIGYASGQQFPEIEAVTEIEVLARVTVGNTPGDRNYERITTIDEDFFNVFNFNFTEGSPQNLFSQANGILLTETLKEKYFGTQSALGKTLKTTWFDAIVAGVIEDFPPNTHLEGDFFFPTQTASSSFDWWDEFVANNWDNNVFKTYFKLRADTDIGALERKITRLVGENWPETKPFRSEFVLQPVEDIHLYAGEVIGEINKSKGNLFYINIFFWIALAILLVACFNYTGLLNVAFMGRSREIGVRKVMGADRKQLIWQFLMESFLLTATALLLAWGILRVIQPVLPDLFGPSFDMTAIPMDQMLLIAGTGLAISFLSISYPVYLISRLAVVKALNDTRQSYRKIPFQKVMTVFQFVAAIILIICTSLLYLQVNYLQKKELGFDLEGLVVVDINSGTLRSKFDTIKQEFSKLPEVKDVTVSSRVPGEWKHFPYVGTVKDGQEVEQAEEMIYIVADQDFLSTYQLSLEQGSNFFGNYADSTKVLINRAAVEALEMKQPVGQWIEIPHVNWSGNIAPFDQPLRVQVAGVVSDFHFEDFRKAIQPMVIGFWRNPIHSIDYYTLRVETSSWSNTISALRRINDRFDNENPMEFNILNDRFQRFYEADILRSRLLLFFAGIVILVACMGLLA